MKNISSISAIQLLSAFNFLSVNGIPRPPEHTLVAEFRRELTQLRDRVNYLLNRLESSGDGESPTGGQQQPADKKITEGMSLLLDSFSKIVKQNE